MLYGRREECVPEKLEAENDGTIETFEEPL